MSVGRRAYDLLRGYIGREWDRIQGLERWQAEEEMRAALDTAASSESPSASPPESTTSNAATSVTPKERACQILGVPADCEYQQVYRVYKRLRTRSDPANFPSGSAEAAKAEEIRRQIEWAYKVLSENVDVTEKRFRSLEIE